MAILPEVETAEQRQDAGNNRPGCVPRGLQRGDVHGALMGAAHLLENLRSKALEALARASRAGPCCKTIVKKEEKTVCYSHHDSDTVSMIVIMS